jgi:hypothetical protein
MDAMTERSDLHFTGSNPVLIAGSSDAALARARRTVDAAGYRIGASMDLGSACERIELQFATAAIWIELDDDAEFEEVLECAGRTAAARGFGAVVSGTAALVDALWALKHDNVELVIDADEADRAAALAIATSRLKPAAAAADIASDRSAERLRQLSDEVSCIAATLARLSSNPPAVAPASAELPRTGSIPNVSADTVRAVIRARRLRSRYFADDLFADPAWDMMLDLLQAEIAQLRVPCRASASLRRCLPPPPSAG